MSAGLKKSLPTTVFTVLLLVVFSLEAEPVLARTAKPEKVRAKRAIMEFLSSVQLSGPAYTFDHDSDGLADLVVYPLKTNMPEPETRYITIKEAIGKHKLLLKEDPRITPSRNNPQGAYPVVAQMFGTGYGTSGSYYPRGGMLGGGWQGRGFMSGGVIGGYGGYGSGYMSGTGTGYYGGNRGYSGYSGGGIGFKDDGFGRTDWKGPAVGGGFGMDDTRTNYYRRPPGSPAEADDQEVAMDALCFEKWRLIEESRLQGEPDFFSYVGMASPFIRKELVSFSNQKNIHIAIETELRKLGINSRTKALTDIFKDRNIQRVIDYYVNNSGNLLKENKNISGMIVTDTNRILCADLYCSADLFGKMFPQLMQSAALAVCKKDGKERKQAGQNEVVKFLSVLKQLEKLKKETPQTYRLFRPGLISAADLDFDKNAVTLVHLEAYPR